MVPSNFIRTPNLILRGLSPEDATTDYLTWLNDPDVLRFRGPKAFPSSMESLRAYLDSVGSKGDLMLAICLQDTGRHIGNITLNSILWVHRSAELSMMIGAKDVWGRGYAKESIQAICKHGFDNMGLNRIWAESPNPAFNAAVKSLGWKLEGTKRKAFLLDGELVNVECSAILKSEFVPLPKYNLP
ncbi:MAG: GNAT family N-acetyltransferase [bacterium]|nr:GNAT family N-acetyltransferase [bacterium]